MNPKQKNNLNALFFGILCSVGILFAYEVYLRFDKSVDLQYFIDRSLKMPLGVEPYFEKSQADIVKKKASHINDTYSAIRSHFPEGNSIKAQMKESSFSIENGSVLQRLTHPENSDLKGDFFYTFDQFKRRNTIGTPKKFKQEVMVIGCSNTFGFGLNDDQTKASYLQSHLKETKVTNFAQNGWGINDHLAAILNLQEYKINPYLQLPKGKAIAIYFFYDFQLIRSTCSLRCYQNDSEWRRKMASWRNINGKLEYQGTFGETLPLRGILGPISDVYILKKNEIDYPSKKNSRVMSAFSQQIIEFKKSLIEKKDVVDFYIAFENGISDSSLKMLGDLERHHGFKLIDMRGVNLYELTDGKDIIPFEGHPSAQTNYVISEAVYLRISKDHPELR
jgi:hypothetical protein